MTEREKLIEILGGMSGIAWSPSVRGIIADYLLANGVTAQKWIPVSERLPDKPGDYLVLSKNRNYSVRTFLIYDEVRKEFIHIENGVITHWMPLPERPKEVPADA